MKRGNDGRFGGRLLVAGEGRSGRFGRFGGRFADSANGKGSDERQLSYRMDGCYMESDDGLHQGLDGLRSVLCRADRAAVRQELRPGAPPGPLEQPLRWRRPRKVFVNSVSDLFHRDVPWGFVDQVLGVMEEAEHHTYQLLTKRSSTMRDYLRSRYAGRECPPHIWCGVSVEDRKALVRVKHLQESPASVRFLSCEPLIGGLDLSPGQLSGIAWVIVGGESGPGARPMSPDWARGVPFAFGVWCDYVQIVHTSEANGTPQIYPFEVRYRTLGKTLVEISRKQPPPHWHRGARADSLRCGFLPRI